MPGRAGRSELRSIKTRSKGRSYKKITSIIVIIVFAYLCDLAMHIHACLVPYHHTNFRPQSI